MRIIIEQTLIWVGILGLVPTIAVMYFGVQLEFLNHSAIPWVIGFAGVLFLIINLMSGIHAYWLIRLCSFLLSLIAVLAISSRM